MANSYTIIGHNEEKKKYNPIKRGIGYTHEIQECVKCLQENRTESELWTHQNSLDLIKLLDDTRDKIGLQFK
jgi:thymidine phosphorylase